MTTPAKALQLILFTNENHTPKTLLKDGLVHNPGYRVGDVIHLIRESHQTRESGPDRQYVVLSAKHVVIADETGSEANDYILLVEVAELTDVEYEPAAHPFSLGGVDPV